MKQVDVSKGQIVIDKKFRMFDNFFDPMPALPLKVIHPFLLSPPSSVFFLSIFESLLCTRYYSGAM